MTTGSSEPTPRVLVDLSRERLLGPDAGARRYAAAPDAAARDALVSLCEPLVRGVASDFSNPALHDDLVQVGYLGLLHAIEHYDPGRGTPFLPFARHFVRGEIRHFLRDHQSMIRRPRWVGQLGAKIDQVVGDYVSARGRYPGSFTLAALLGVDEDQLTAVLKTRQVVRTLSLDAEDDEGQPSIDLSRTLGSHAGWLESSPEDRVVLIEAMGRLNPLHRAVVFYVFFTDLTQMETAQRLGISQKHVSRVLASALLRLRALLGP